MGQNLAAAPHLVADFRAEILTRPTDAMWEAMQKAEIGSYVAGEDKNVRELERRMAELTGKESAFFVATGATATALALLGLSQRGEQVIADSRSHLHWAEGNNAAYVAGATLRLVEGDEFGRIAPGDLARVMDEAVYGYMQRTAIVSLENTHNVAGGCVLSSMETETLANVAKARGARVLVDGARLWNAAAYEGASLKDMLRGVDAGMVSMNKGLGAPVGAVLVGTQELIDDARVNVRRLGSSGMHRMGLFAAAALVALDTMQDRIVEDHVRARKFAEELSSIEGLSVHLETVQTNIVRVEVDHPKLDAERFVARLQERGIGARVLEHPNALKFHTYWEIGDREVDMAGEACRKILKES